MRGSIVVLALAVTPFVARVSDAQVRSHAVRHETPIARHNDDHDRGRSDDKKCEDRRRGNPSDRGAERRADPRSRGNKDCDSQSGSDNGGTQTPPPSPDPAPAPSPDPAPAPAPAPDPVGHTAVYGSVFFDIDHDGAFGVDEVGLSGWTVQLSGPVSMTTTTDGAGAYSFVGLPNDGAHYTVCVIPPAGWTQTAIAGAPSCGANLFGYPIDAATAATAIDISYTGIDFGFVSN